MIKKLTESYLDFSIPCLLFTQTNSVDYLNIRCGNGQQLRFWSNDNYKISMGNNTEYKYDPMPGYRVEEPTLYMIQLKKENDQLKKRTQKLENDEQ